MKNGVMPDISTESRAELAMKLDQVGMSEIEMPVILKVAGELPFRIPAKISAFVSLDEPQAKGIHMSRLYLSLKEILGSETLSLKTTKHILQKFIKDQKGLSERAYLKVSFELPIERKALKSDQIGWRQYPVFLEGQLTGEKLAINMGVQIAYSSTCPCSTALAKQLIVDEFQNDFKDREIIKNLEIKEWLKQKALLATPHAQRSYADIKVKLDINAIAPDFVEVIDLVEEELKTVVQAAVKREDEQEFARLNGENNMFCEDACRKIKKALNSDQRFLDYKIVVSHQESLHPHNAVSGAVKGIEGGFQF
ncbi:MAG: GTP cyclohydrolase I FolE2 [Bdellovibrionales bacterium]|nr:GTP cyclohydrolase I FolE2 [Bdellovibrionales bacterium]